jgi:chemotaxis protein methyltransferase CheR
MVRSYDPEIAQLLDDMLLGAGADFRGWEPSVVSAAVRDRIAAEGAADVAALRARILDDRQCLERLVLALTARSQRPFTDAGWVKMLRDDLAPRLRTYPSLRVWVPGCGGSGDVYTTAIALREEKLLDRAQIYATEETESALAHAKDGTFEAPLEEVAAEYAASGGRASLTEYYLTNGRRHEVRPLLRHRVTFAVHSFATDASFNEFHLIVCRGVLPRFGSELRGRAARILEESMCHLGFLVLGRDEATLGAHLERVLSGVGLYRRTA